MMKKIASFLIVLLLIASGCGTKEEGQTKVNGSGGDAPASSESDSMRDTEADNDEDGAQADGEETSGEPPGDGVEPTDPDTPTSNTDVSDSGDAAEDTSEEAVQDDAGEEPAGDGTTQDDIEQDPAQDGDAPEPKSGTSTSSPPIYDEGRGDSGSGGGAKGIVAGSLEPTLTYEVNNNDVTFHFMVKNQTEHHISLNFDTSHKFDYIIMDADGKVVEQYSKSQAALQVMGEDSLIQGGEMNFTVTVEDLAPGTYSAVFILTAKEMQPKVGVEFEVK